MEPEKDATFDRIITHNDFDGVASAAICSYLFDVEKFAFTGPNSVANLELQPVFQKGVKTTDISVSMSLSLNMNTRDHRKDVGEIMRELNLGDGHPGAGAGTLNSSSKSEMMRRKEEMCRKIFELWKSQYLGGSVTSTQKNLKASNNFNY